MDLIEAGTALISGMPCLALLGLWLLWWIVIRRRD